MADGEGTALPEGFYRRKDSKYIWIRYTDQNGKQQFESSKSTNLKKAQQLRATRLDQVYDNRFYPQRHRRNPSIGDMLKEYLAIPAVKKQSDYKRQVARAEKLKEYFKPETLVRSLAADDIHKFMTWMAEEQITKRKKGYSNASINRHLALLSVAFNTIPKVGPDWNPFADVKMLPESAGREAIVTEEMYKSFIAHAPQQLKVAIITGWFYGMRQGLIVQIDKTWIDRESMVLTIPSAIFGNKGRPRELPISKELLQAWDSLPVNKEHPTKVFTSSAAAIANAFNKLKTDLHYPEIVFHSLRHSAATRLRRAGVDTHTIMEICGWKSPQMFKRYSHVDIDDKRRAMNMLLDDGE